MSYFDEITKAMTLLSKDKRVYFLGQSVKYPGNALFKTLKDIPMNRRYELGVCEELQMGISTGLALTGLIPVSIYPRMDFLICAMNQLVNHLDSNLYPGKVIIRTAIGSKSPLYPGVQHCQNHTGALMLMLKNVKVIYLVDPEEIVLAYDEALHSPGSYLMVEDCNLYGME